ncbi:MAG: hypothetical protein GYA24_03065 [Candidatus Lokiarchaeota archaeon]|nr:hypothetical protein [Candidatus Lokiarchaeota archaeon]
MLEGERGTTTTSRDTADARPARGNPWLRDILVRKSAAPAQSLVTIDTLKGISILVILYIHVGNVWCAPDFVALMKAQWYFLDFLGPAMFLTLSVVGNMAGSLGQKPNGKGPAIPRRRVLRVSFLLGYGEIINIMTAWRQGIFHASAWNVITTIAVFTLLMPYIVKLPKLARVVLLIAITVTYYPLMEWAIVSIRPHGISLATTTIDMLLDPRTFIYWLLFYSDMMTPVFSWLIVPIAASLIFDKIVWMTKAGANGAVQAELKKIAVIGACLVLASLLTSLHVIPEYNQSFFQALMTPSPYFTWPIPAGMPPFLVRHVPQYLFYCIGAECLLFSGIGWMQLVKGKRMPFEEKINNCGKLSITVFALSYVLSMLQLDLPIGLFYFVMIPVVVLVVVVCWIWSTRGHRIGSIEWMMDVHVRVISHFLDLRAEKEVTRARGARAAI